MSVYNGARYLESAINSIRQQSLADFEFIIVNDGSTDATGPILAAAAAEDPRIRVLAHSNQGLTRSLNVAIAHSRGTYIARMDADDVSLPNRFATQLSFFMRYPDLVALGADVLLIDPDGWPLRKRGHALDHRGIERQLLAGHGGAITHPVVVMSAAALKQVGGYREKFTTVQDLDLFLRLAEVGRVANLPDVLLLWRQHPGSINHTQYQAWRQMKGLALSDAAARRGIPLDVPHLLRSEPSPGPLSPWHLRYANEAVAGRYFHTALKHILLAILKGDSRLGRTGVLMSLLNEVARRLLGRRA